MAYNELRRLQSTVRIPGVYYACRIGILVYIVMEYVQGETAETLLNCARDEAAKEHVYRKMCFGLNELLRIPVPQKSRPQAVNGDRIRNMIFEDAQAPRHYQTVEQLEQHFNLYLKKRRKKHLIRSLSSEPMVFCYSDIRPENFIIDKDNQIFVIDFAHTSFLPSSFFKANVRINSLWIVEYDLAQWINIPSREGIDNSLAVANCDYISDGSASERTPGYGWKPDNVTDDDFAPRINLCENSGLKG
ncbi:hypothetical protein PRK78_006100 [Emydomyces testavorans]|uniref:Aminoglycoside phosphotransferase domain-containing protein n=1 Tax=Emydomyces testavorans TaxID=2070801 RepID=A0AAF0IKK3_9EURO|nr:hypothetical protein PRK78_006100 [Emydomyces testavorans]